MLAAVATGVTSAITYIGEVISAIADANGAFGAVLPLVGLAVGMFVVSFGIGIVKSLIKGY